MRTSMTLNLSDDTLFQLMRMAHERDVTLNDLVNDILREYIAAHPLPKAAAKSWVVTTEDAGNGELFLPLPEELIHQMDWKVGDTLLWEDLGNGTFGLKRAES